MWQQIERIWERKAKAASRRLAPVEKRVNKSGVRFSKVLVKIVSAAVYIVKEVISVVEIVGNAYIDGNLAIARAASRLARMMWEEDAYD